MSKKARNVPVDAFPSTSYCQVGEDARARFRFQYLTQDFEELRKETEAKKINLHKAKVEKLRLLAEVKFLRRKYKSLLENPTRTTLCRVKKQYHKMPSISNTSFPTKLHVNNGLPFKGSDHRAVDAAKPRTSTMLDLNQVSLPIGEVEEFQMQLKGGLLKSPLKSESPSKICSTNGDHQDQNLTVSLVIGNKSITVRNKRKVKWEDQIAMKV